MDTTANPAHVYLMGDSCPIPTTLSVDEVMARLADAETFAKEASARGYFRVPSEWGDAVIACSAVAAILPQVLTDEDDD